MEDLIKKFKTVPVKQPENETILSICGFPHYEKVASNILSFFFDSEREHGLKYLFLKCLFELIDIDWELVSSTFVVETEVRTINGKFIDLYIHNDEYSIVIENKVYAWLYNNLDDYYQYVSDKSPNKKGVVLSLFPQEEKNGNYKYITYIQLFNVIRKNIGKFIEVANQKYLNLLFDFIKNMENLKGGEDMDMPFVEFVKNNSVEVLNLNWKLKELHDNLRRIVQRVNSIIIEKINDSNIRQWPWRTLPDIFDTAVTDMNINGASVAINSFIDSNGWRFELLLRANNPNQSFDIGSYIKEKKIDATPMKPTCYKINKNYNIDEKVETVAEFIISLIKQLK